MKSILLSIKPEWLVKILNGEKTIEVRKKFPKDYVGWVYLYCSKGKPRVIIQSNGVIAIDNKHYSYGDEELNGKVVARFWCDKVTEMIVGEDCCGDAEIEEGCDLIDQTCLTEIEIIKYLGGIGKNGYAIHISKLEIFDKPRELSEFKHITYFRRYGSFRVDIEEQIVPLTKAPQNYCYIEGEQR